MKDILFELTEVHGGGMGQEKSASCAKCASQSCSSCASRCGSSHCAS